MQTVFEEHFAQGFWFRFCFHGGMTQIQTNLFWPPLIERVPPYGEKFEKFWNVDFDSSKEASWCTERKATNHSTISEKIKKNWFSFYDFFWVFWQLFFIFSETVACKELCFLGLHSAHHDNRILHLSCQNWLNPTFHCMRDPYDLSALKICSYAWKYWKN